MRNGQPRGTREEQHFCNGHHHRGGRIANYNSISPPSGLLLSSKMSGDTTMHGGDQPSPEATDHGWCRRRRSAGGNNQLISVEPAMFLFMLSAMVKFPVFQSLLYEKACLGSHRFNASMCADIRAVHRDVELQREANHVLLASSLCLLGPSIPTALLLGALFDSWSARKALMIPLIGVLLADLNYVLQCLNMDWSVYWLLGSDLVFGFAGGFTSIIGLFFAYNVKVTKAGLRSVRVATMEGALGLGVMCGFLLSGQLRQAFGYAWVFSLVSLLHLVILGFVLFFVRELPTSGTIPGPGPGPAAVEAEGAEAEDEQVERRHILSPGMTSEAERPEGEAEEQRGTGGSNDDAVRFNNPASSSSVCCWGAVGHVVELLQRRVRDIARVYRARREPVAQRCLNIVLVALGINLFTASGLLDIMFSFLRFQLQWTDREYGWFSGLNSGLNSLSVLLAYPLLHRRFHLGDLQLALAGLGAKVVHLLVLCLASSTLVAMLSLAPALLSRFPTAAMRAMASACVRQHEQGKVFALISLMDGLASLCASLFFNGLYPYTLHFFAGSMLLLIALLLLVPIGLLLFLHFSGLDSQLQLLNRQQQPI